MLNMILSKLLYDVIILRICKLKLQKAILVFLTYLTMLYGIEEVLLQSKLSTYY